MFKNGGENLVYEVTKNKEWEGWAGVLVDLRVKLFYWLGLGLVNISKMFYCLFGLKFREWEWGEVNGPCPPNNIDQFFVIFVSKRPQKLGQGVAPNRCWKSGEVLGENSKVR